MASHSFGATTPRSPLSQITFAPGMSLIEASSTAVGTEPAIWGMIVRACNMPGSLMSVTKSSVPSSFQATSRRGAEVP